MLLNGGELDGRRIIGRKTLEYMTINHLPEGKTLNELGQSLFSEAEAHSFHHGLGFSTFSFGAPANATCTDAHAVLCVTSVVTNTGKFTAGTVAQAYVTFSPEAGQHAPLLKGFVKTPALGGGGTHEVTFELSERDVSYYGDGGWRKAASVTVQKPPSRC